MSDTNSVMTENIKGLNVPDTFTTDLAAAADDPARVQLLIDMVEKEATDPDDHRLFLDEMSPACRDSLSVLLRALKAATT